MTLPRAALLAHLVILLSAQLNCSSTEEQADPAPAAPTVATLDRLLQKESASAPGGDLESCLAAVQREELCQQLPGSRTLSIRLALDPRYPEHWQNAQGRLDQTLSCVNRLYLPTGIEWRIQQIQPWDPGAARHNLSAALDRVQQAFPHDGKSFVVGVTLWEERQVYKTSGGTIGLSQPGRAVAVIPSWPRIENDCLIMAHELGHLVGARHVPGKNGIMAWAGGLYYLPSSDPIGRVVATYRFDRRNLEVIRMHQLLRFVEGTVSIPTSCIRKIELLDQCWHLN